MRQAETTISAHAARPVRPTMRSRKTQIGVVEDEVESGMWALSAVHFPRRPSDKSPVGQALARRQRSRTLFEAAMRPTGPDFSTARRTVDDGLALCSRGRPE